MSHTFKTGKWSKAELAQTKELIEQGLTYEQISEKINRPVSSIKSHVEEELLLNLTDEAKHAKSAEQTLRNSPEWKEIELQLSKEEQELFVYHWKEIVGTIFIQLNYFKSATNKIRTVWTVFITS